LIGTKWLYEYAIIPSIEEGLQKEKVANIVDVKNQLTILINERFSNLKDRRDFRSELLPLLKELE
jgi:hypothetical protein